MRIHKDFLGGNIEVVMIENTEVYLKNELRDTSSDWFYWAFCVEGAQGQTLTFHLDKKWIGYYGPAVSHNLRDWNWLGAEDVTCSSDTFTYTFGKEEQKVYFAHDMLYNPDRFREFCERQKLEIKPLCKSAAGEVPYVTLGCGEEIMIITSRHHACESTGTYVLEGVLEELKREFIPGLQLICVPFVDYDGVVNGDQGKNRIPWDHNRDYGVDEPPIYPVTAVLRQLAKNNRVRYAFDFHSPWHAGKMNDREFIIRKDYGVEISRFSIILEESITPNSLPYVSADVMPLNVDWNQGNPSTFARSMKRHGAELSFTTETPYFNVSGVPFTVEKGLEFGRCFARALRIYHDVYHNKEQMI